MIVAELESFINDYATLPRPHYALPIALWALGTHCHQSFSTFGFLIFSSETTGSGKTLMLNLLKQIVADGRVQDNITLAALVAITEKDHPTILIDQAEKLATKDNNPLYANLLTRYKKGAQNTIMQRGQVVERGTYGPCAFALVGDIGAAARDRAIIIPMKPMPVKVDVLECDWTQRGEKLKKRCAAAIERKEAEIEKAISNYQRLKFLNGRENEIWKPLVVMCDIFASERRRELEMNAADICAAKRKAPVRISVEEANRRADMLRDGERLIRDLLAIIGDGFGIQGKEALPKLMAIHDAPWRNYADEGLSEAKMVELLAVFNIHSKQSKKFSKDRGNLRGYLWSDLEAALEEKTPYNVLVRSVNEALEEAEPEQVAPPKQAATLLPSPPEAATPLPSTSPEEAATPLPPKKPATTAVSVTYTIENGQSRKA